MELVTQQNIKVGLRVMRGPDWNHVVNIPVDDNLPGTISTLIEDKEACIVTWDSTGKESEQYYFAGHIVNSKPVHELCIANTSVDELSSALDRLEKKFLDNETNSGNS